MRRRGEMMRRKNKRDKRTILKRKEIKEETKRARRAR